MAMRWAMWAVLILCMMSGAVQAAAPNVVLIFTDDQAYGDLGCYGGTHVVTPHLDRLATQGMRFTDFYVAQAVCGASRAALLTGCYPNRIGIQGAPGPKSRIGIADDEVLLSELLKSRGYATAAIGKWHLGDNRKFLPKQHGFDSYFGLPYSNDMWPFHPEGARFPELPLIDGNDIVNANVTSEDQTQLTRQYTEHAVEFIRHHHQGPFFLYLAHSMPHVPLHVSEKFNGRTGKGLFADVIAEIDDSLGQVLAVLDELHLRDNTLVIFATDNGPWMSYGNHAGSAGPLREGKGTTFEGGVRVPCLMRWPGHIPSGAVCRELAATIDIVPTIAGIVGAELPKHSIDGRDILPVMTGQPGSRTPHESYLYYWGSELQAIRSGRFKLHFPHKYRSLTGTPGKEGKPAGYSEQSIELSLYDLEADIGESRDIKSLYPDVVGRLQHLAEQARADLGDSALKLKGSGLREPGRWSPEMSGK